MCAKIYPYFFLQNNFLQSPRRGATGVGGGGGVEFSFCLMKKKHKNKNTAFLILLLLSHFSRVRLCATQQTAAHQAPPSLGFPGKNTGVGCHFLLQSVKVKSESEVAQSCRTLSNPMDCSFLGSSVHGIFQAKVLEWGAISFSVLDSSHSQKNSPFRG